MRIIIALLVLLAICVVSGVIRVLRGGTFLPPPGLDGDHHVRGRDGRWWRVEDDGTVEEPFSRKRTK
ncbi:MAG TPA: hypothetical protein VGJ20_21040 [Xanthobacteraceae bacterium]|jgi:hypothetical protein